MAVSFSTPDKFDRQKAYTQVVYGYDAPLMETELNEMQKIFSDKFSTLTKAIASNGFVNAPAMSVAAGTFTLPIDSFTLNGIVFQMFEPMTISVVNGDTIFLAVWEQNVTFSSAIKVGGNQSGGSAVADNGILDARIGEETTRRLQLQMQLVKSNADSSKQYIPVATMITAATFTDNRTRSRLNLALPTNFIDTANLKDSSVSDSKIGDRTLVDTVAPTGNAGPLTTLLSGILYMFKAFSGKPDWRTAPRTTLENAVKLDGDTMSGALNVNARTHVKSAAGKDLSINDWGDISANSSGHFLVANNAYTADSSLYKYSTTHATMGARGIRFSSAGLQFFDTGSISTTIDAEFTPTWNTVLHSANHNSTGDPHTQYIQKTQIGAANGLATLGADSKVPAAQLPSLDYIPNDQRGVASGVATLDSGGKVTSTQLPSLDYIPNSQKGAVNGVASLGSDGKVPSGQLPSLNYLPIAGGTLTGGLTIAPAAGNAVIEFGNGAVVNTPAFDFHSSGAGSDFDVRLVASGGSATSGQGVLNIHAANVIMSGKLDLNTNPAARLILPVGADKYAV